MSQNVSIHARPRGARRQGPLRRAAQLIKFQSTPGPEGPGDGLVDSMLARRHVSIHARPRGARRQESAEHEGKDAEFQSTPGPEGPGDLQGRQDVLGDVLFQSTPGPEGPGDQDAHLGNVGHGVSIHARPRGARRPEDLLPKQR